MIQQAGTYQATVESVVIAETKGGGLMAVALHHVTMPDGSFEEAKSYTTMIAKDGTVLTRSIDNIKKWSGWDGTDPMDLMALQFPFEVSVVIEMEPGLSDPDKLFPKVKWVNPAGGAAMPATISKSEFSKKYAAKFRAVSGTKPAAPQAAKKTAPAPSAPVKKAPAPAKPVSSKAPTKEQWMERVWQEFQKLNGDLKQSDMEAKWFAFVEDQVGQVPQDEITVEQWSKMFSELTGDDSDLPF